MQSGESLWAEQHWPFTAWGRDKAPEPWCLQVRENRTAACLYVQGCTLCSWFLALVQWIFCQWALQDAVRMTWRKCQEGLWMNVRDLILLKKWNLCPCPWGLGCDKIAMLSCSDYSLITCFGFFFQNRLMLLGIRGCSWTSNISNIFQVHTLKIMLLLMPYIRYWINFNFEFTVYFTVLPLKCCFALQAFERGVLPAKT